MEIFSTREIAIFIYAIILFVYVLLHKKGKTAAISVIKAACHIKLVIPFITILLFAAVFTWLCTYLPFWNWAYIKDIAFWTLFAGVPVCFNATSRNLEEHYFRDIIIDNLKFATLVEFVTGTFTFNIAIELLLQPILVFFFVLQSIAQKKSESVKKIVDGIVGFTGLIIIAFTIKSAIDAIGNVQFIDILVSFMLPIILSIVYLPIAYFFAVYSKYEILFMRMGFKESKNNKLRIKQRLKVIFVCKLSYKKVCKFLNDYVQKMYVNMSSDDFEKILNDFQNPNKHTYVAVIKHNGKYYVSRDLTSNDVFSFKKFTTENVGAFKSSNKMLRKEIAKQIIGETSFENRDYSGDQCYKAVSLRRMVSFNKKTFFERTKIAIFVSNEMKTKPQSIDLPFGKYIKEQCDDATLILMKILKWDTIWPAFLATSIYFLAFLLSSFFSNNTNIDLDVLAFVFVVINYVCVILNHLYLSKFIVCRKLLNLQNLFSFNGISEFIVFLVALLIVFILPPINISHLVLSKLGIAFIFLDILINLIKRDQ